MPPVINPDLCIRCDRCVNICTEDVFFGSTKNELPLIAYPRECVHFSGCVDACPVPGAIWLRIPLPAQLVYKVGLHPRLVDQEGSPSPLDDVLTSDRERVEN
jgi:NAD-dependent dihydropyrimidine dehydrogenase PreA subunit